MATRWCGSGRSVHLSDGAWALAVAMSGNRFGGARGSVLKAAPRSPPRLSKKPLSQ
jgi:hypothetical protein